MIISVFGFRSKFRGGSVPFSCPHLAFKGISRSFEGPYSPSGPDFANSASHSCLEGLSLGGILILRILDPSAFREALLMAHHTPWIERGGIMMRVKYLLTGGE